MVDYKAPLRDMQFLLEELAGLDEIAGLPGCEEASGDLVAAVLEEAGRFAAGVLAPINRAGDVQGCRLDGDGRVHLPDGWKAAYERFSEAGWIGLSLPQAWGGQGLPRVLSTAVWEMWFSTNMAFAMLPQLNVSQAEALLIAGDAAQKETWLRKVVSGEWGSTMNLTEPQAGSDLAATRCRAEPQADGSYRVFGQKIFISYGEHELTGNIVHLVLARLPDAPAGVKGLSLFIVPKYLLGADGEPGARNDVRCISIEHKLGIHGSPTAVMKFGEKGGAIGYLVGQENRGLNTMFIMMNAARLAVGIQGVAVAERATQHAVSYAKERRQGRTATSAGMVAIAEHPDVRRNLLTMKALTRAARAICYATAADIDRARHAATEADRRAASDRAALLTPVAKAFSTDIGCEVASIGVQVHGGMGFIEETGAAQYYRDARILPIYEGTNGIQAIDLVTRKLPLAGGNLIKQVIAEFEATARQLKTLNRLEIGRMGQRLSSTVVAFAEATAWMLEAIEHSPNLALAGATPYLRLFGLAAGGHYLAKGALAGLEVGGPHAMESVALARFFAENISVAGPGLASVVTSGGHSVIGAIPESELA